MRTRLCRRPAMFRRHVYVSDILFYRQPCTSLHTRWVDNDVVHKMQLSYVPEI